MSGTTYTDISVLIATPITAAMLTAGTTIAEPDAGLGESLWVASAAYSLGDEKIYDHKVYYCWLAHTGISVTPDVDTAHWLLKRPSNLFAPFDVYTATAAKATGGMVYELDPGFFRDLAIFGAVGETVRIEVFDAPGGAVLRDETIDLWEQALGLWELLFAPLGSMGRVDVRGIDISPTARLRVTIAAGVGAPVALGLLEIGEWRSFTGGTGGTEYGGECEPKSMSYIKFYDDGTFEIKRRAGFTDLSIPALFDADQADYCVALLQQVLDVPVSFSATGVPGYGYLSGRGLISGTVSPINAKDARLTARLKGTI